MKRILAILLVLLVAASTGCGLFPLPTSHAPTPTVALITAAPSIAPSPTPIQPTLPNLPTAMTAPAPTPTTGTRFEVEGLTTQQLLDVFRTVAGSSEYGSSGTSIRKWAMPIKLVVQGDPTEEDMAAVHRVVEWLNGIEGYPGISLAEKDGNAAIWFVNLDEMKNVVDGYVAGNWGFFWTEFDSKSITKATVAIANDVTSQTARNHLVFEELVQSMGLMQDHYTYEDSIFYGNWTTVQKPSEMDEALVAMLYVPGIKHGMPVNDAIAILEGSMKP